MFQNKWPTTLNDNNPNPTHTSVPSTQNTPTATLRQQTTYNGVCTDIIQKNVKIPCQYDTQLLDFYIKLCTAMIQAGIFLRKINNINEDEDIYEE